MIKKISLSDRFFSILQEIVDIQMFINIVPFIQGEDALLLQLFYHKIISPTELSKNLNITKGRVTAIINSLSKKEFIEISVYKDDRRKIQVSLSQTGQIYLSEKLKNTEEHFIQLFKNIGEEKSIKFIDLLEEVIKVAKEL